jgi:hypothetical protein
MTARDELAKVIVAAYGEDAEVECPCEQDLDVAEAILSAGYRKPRTIDDVAELNSLPASSVIRIQQHMTLERLSTGWYQAAVGIRYEAYPNWLPATVLYEPTR